MQILCLNTWEFMKNTKYNKAMIKIAVFRQQNYSHQVVFVLGQKELLLKLVTLQKVGDSGEEGRLTCVSIIATSVV